MTTDPEPVTGPTPIFDELVTQLGEPDFTPAPSYDHVVHVATTP